MKKVFSIILCFVFLVGCSSKMKIDTKQKSTINLEDNYKKYNYFGADFIIPKGWIELNKEEDSISFSKDNKDLLMYSVTDFEKLSDKPIERAIDSIKKNNLDVEVIEKNDNSCIVKYRRKDSASKIIQSVMIKSNKILYIINDSEESLLSVEIIKELSNNFVVR